MSRLNFFLSVPTIGKIFGSRDNKRLVSNFLSLSVLQGANYILPLITIPYLVRVLGVDRFGLISFAVATIAYFQIVIDYGFNLTATRDITINRDNKRKISEIFSAIITTKFILTLLCFVVLVAMVSLFSKFQVEKEVYFLTFLIVIGQVIFPTWLFQGMESMKVIALLNLLSKGLFTILIFVFVRNSNDYLFVPLFTGMGSALSGIIALVISLKWLDFPLRLPSKDLIIFQLKDAWHIFITNVSVSIYTITVVMILGILTTNEIVGYYAIGFKLIGAMKSLNGPISQSLFPFVTRKAQQSKAATLKFLKKLTVSLGFLMLLLSAIVFVFSKEIVVIIFGLEGTKSIEVVRILAIVPFLVTLDTMLGTLTMIVFNKKKEYSRIIMSAGVINLIMSTVLILLYNHIGASFAVLITEIYITLRIFLYTNNNELKVF
ncbi:flippase [Reichenbachiella agarivorans]|uniref:Flippase n=1 Tax=Reichenbachiella agarivorans TaxID=2979464 RepID=A0ABY6CSS6_9BACT|nr:flippase [Reichenbachiella agarivorans]UXP33556.1 flippase [Reichenbachiella agarivorans]